MNLQAKKILNNLQKEVINQNQLFKRILIITIMIKIKKINKKTQKNTELIHLDIKKDIV